MPKLEPVVQKSSSPALLQPEAPSERPEADVSVSEPSASVEPELSFHASLAAALPITAANAGPPARESTPTSAASVGESKSSVVAPHTPNVDKTLPDPPQPFDASPSAAPKALNGLADSGNELDLVVAHELDLVVAHEPSLLPPTAPRPLAPAYRDASSSETVPSDMRPEVPIAAALSPLSPVAVVPVTLTSSPHPVLLPPGLPPLVQATPEADEPSKNLDIKDLVSRTGIEAQSGITEIKMESQQQALTRRSPTTGNGFSIFNQHNYFLFQFYNFDIS